MKEDLHGKEREKKLKSDKKVIARIFCLLDLDTLLRSSSSSIGGT